MSAGKERLEEDAKSVANTVLSGDISTVLHFDGILHRFHRTELRPINFGTPREFAATPHAV